MRRLLIRPGAIGDFILSLPALEHLKAGYTEVWCAGQNVPLARFADEARSIVSAGLDRVAISPAIDCFERLESFHEIHSWYGTARDDFKEAVRELPFRFYPALPSGAFHATEFYCRQVGAPVTSPRVATPPVHRQSFVVLHPFASGPRKRWPMENFQKLSAMLEDVHPGGVRWCAGPEEELVGAVRIEDLYRLATWLSSARAFVGNDSGITHLAAAAGVPVTAIFGPTDPGVWAPTGLRVEVVRDVPIESVAPERVLKSVLSLV